MPFYLASTYIIDLHITLQRLIYLIERVEFLTGTYGHEYNCTLIITLHNLDMAESSKLSASQTFAPTHIRYETLQVIVATT